MSVSTGPSVTLSEVLQLALPPGSRTLASQRALSRRIHWARLLRARPAGLGSVEPGELLVLSSSLLESLNESRVLARLIREMVEAGVAAFVIVGEPSAALTAACAETDTALLQVPAGASVVEVERSIVGLILDRDAQLRRRAEEIYGRLLASMLGNAGLPTLIEALAEATGLRAAVFDDYLALQACAPADESFKQAVMAATNHAWLHEAGLGAVRMGRVLFVRFTHEGSEWRGQLRPLQLGSAWAGLLGLFDRQDESGELDRLLADRASSLVALELAKQRAVAEATQRWRGEFLDDLLEASFPSDEAVLARGRQLGYDLARPHLAFALGADPQPELNPGGEVSISTSRPRRRFTEIARTVTLRVESRALAVDRDGALVALLPAGSADEPEAIVDLVDRLRAEVEVALGEVGVSAGVGRAVRQPREVAGAYREAAQALAIAQKLLGGGRTVHYDLLGIERLLYHLLDNPEFERFALDVLGDLLAYDAEHRAELVRTVEVFLGCNGNHVRAAHELHLHRNTLLYRLDRAREILGRDLEDADTRLALQVALRIRRALPDQAVPLGKRAARRFPGRRRRVAG